MSVLAGDNNSWIALKNNKKNTIETTVEEILHSTKFNGNINSEKEKRKKQKQKKNGQKWIQKMKNKILIEIKWNEINIREKTKVVYSKRENYSVIWCHEI